MIKKRPRLNRFDARLVEYDIDKDKTTFSLFFFFTEKHGFLSKMTSTPMAYDLIPVTMISILTKPFSKCVLATNIQLLKIAGADEKSS